MSTEKSRLYNFVDDKTNGIPITASRVDAELDQDITALNQKVIIKASAPSTPIAGMLWYDSSNKVLKQYRNAEWVLVNSVHSGTTAPTTMQFGDMWIDSSASEAVVKFRNKASDANIQLLDTNSSASLNNAFVPTGTLLMWGTTSAPTGYLICDGSAVSRTTYAALFAVISTTYGSGDGSTTFNLPNLKGKVPVGRDSGDTAFDVMGETGGAKTHTLTTAELPSHTHNIATEQANAFGTAKIANTQTGTGNAATIATASAGSGDAHNNLQPYIVLNFIIKI